MQFNKFGSKKIHEYNGCIDDLKKMLFKKYSENINFAIIDDVLTIFKNQKDYDKYLSQVETNDKLDNLTPKDTKKKINKTYDIKEYQRKYREKHRETLKAKQQIYYSKNREALLIQKRDYDRNKYLIKKQEKEALDK